MSDPRFSPLRFDPARWTIGDAVGTMRSVPSRWRDLTDGVEQVPTGVLVALQEIGDSLSAAGGVGSDLAALIKEPSDSFADIAARVGADAALVESVEEHSPLMVALSTVEELLSAAARLVATEIVSPETGRLVALHQSNGGVPKQPVESAVVDLGGVVGDVQRTREHHGRPSQALSLWSAEVIEELRAEGHPVAPGAAGENLTVAGLEWAKLRPGVRLIIGADHGTAVVAELTWWAEPCRKIARCFSDQKFSRIGHSHNPGWSRAYAAVLRGGNVQPGDPVVVLP